MQMWTINKLCNNLHIRVCHCMEPWFDVGNPSIRSSLTWSQRGKSSHLDWTPMFIGQLESLRKISEPFRRKIEPHCGKIERPFRKTLRSSFAIIDPTRRIIPFTRLLKPFKENKSPFTENMNLFLLVRILCRLWNEQSAKFQVARDCYTVACKL